MPVTHIIRNPPDAGQASMRKANSGKALGSLLRDCPSSVAPEIWSVATSSYAGRVGREAPHHHASYLFAPPTQPIRHDQPLTAVYREMGHPHTSPYGESIHLAWGIVLR